MKKSFVLYHDYKELFEALSDSQLATIIRAIFAYEVDAELPNLDSTLSLLFIQIRQSLDRNRENWEKECNQRKEAGKKGGKVSAAKRRLGALSAAKHRQANQADSVSVNVNVPVNEIKINHSVGKNPDNAQLRKDAKEVLSFLNEKTGRRYRESDANIKLIIARLKSGVTLQDCRCVIAKKCRDWLTDEKMNLYLRPATLFNSTKFEQYLGELYYGNE